MSAVLLCFLTAGAQKILSSTALPAVSEAPWKLFQHPFSEPLGDWYHAKCCVRMWPPPPNKITPFFRNFPKMQKVERGQPPKMKYGFFQTTTFPKCFRLCFLFEVGDLSLPKLISFAEGLIKVSSSQLPGRRSTKQRWQRLAGSSRKNMSRLMFFCFLWGFLQMQQTTVYIFKFKKHM